MNKVNYLFNCIFNENYVVNNIFFKLSFLFCIGVQTVNNIVIASGGQDRVRFYFWKPVKDTHGSSSVPRVGWERVVSLVQAMRM